MAPRCHRHSQRYLAFFWLTCGWSFLVAAVNIVQDGASFDLRLVPPYVPSKIAVNETVSALELRVDCVFDDPTVSPPFTTLVVRVTPASATVVIEPRTIVFALSSDSQWKGVQHVALWAVNDQSPALIEYRATIETNSGESSTAQFASQSIAVLPEPVVFSVRDPQWTGDLLWSDSFEASPPSQQQNISPLWGVIEHGFPSSSCGAADGTTALYFTSLGDRVATTAALFLDGFHGRLLFHHVYGFERTQKYDSTGDNRVACDTVEPGEEVVLLYLPADQDFKNASAVWPVLSELPLPRTEAARGQFREYVVPLPTDALHAAARLRWRQKQHSSFPLNDALVGQTAPPLLPMDELTRLENLNTSINGAMAPEETNFWRYRNLFDQWALDNVRLELRLNSPLFDLVDVAANGSVTVVGFESRPVSLGFANLRVSSPVRNTWVVYTLGDGTQRYPSCDDTVAPPPGNAMPIVRLNTTGYVHAVVCLRLGDRTVSSYATRSPRVIIQAAAPVLTATRDAATAVDTWTIRIECARCEFMRYAIDRDNPRPSCVYGEWVNGTSGAVVVRQNSKLAAIACDSRLLPSAVTTSSVLNVVPRQPTFDVTYEPATINNQFNVTIQAPTPPVNAASWPALHLAYIVVSDDASSDVPSCATSDINDVQVTVTVRASDVVKAVTCCVDEATCLASTVATSGPIVDVKAMTPLLSSVCSRSTPLGAVVTLAPVTQGAWIEYTVRESTQNAADVPLPNCLTTPQPTAQRYTEPFTVRPSVSSRQSPSPPAMVVTAVSCLAGLRPSDPVVAAVPVSSCCAGLDAYSFPTCRHVLLLHDDFSQCLEPSKWTAITAQWADDAQQSGVHRDNVRCTDDTSRRKRVLTLTAQGDLYNQSTPTTLPDVGQAPVAMNEPSFLDGWALPGVSSLACNAVDGRCQARRIGAAVQTAALALDAGVAVLRVRPCDAFGTLTQLWWGPANPVAASLTLRSGVPYLPLWKAGMYQAKTTVTPTTTSWLGVSSPSTRASDGFVELAMQWNASLGRSNLFVDGRLVHVEQRSTAGDGVTKAPLSLGVWFPNAVAGEPLFATCRVDVDEVSVFSAEITGDRWCDDVLEAAAYEEDAAEDDSVLVPCVDDADCENWVTLRCLMSVYEATCVIRRPREDASFTAQDSETADDSVSPTTEDDAAVGDADGVELDTTSVSEPRRVCRFRLAPTTREEYATTEMTRRRSSKRWRQHET
ncbi:hypothetical protein PINS_up015731 [Pythium insidiosum]|nr:hypothetical protein PINS_up015731 [Pythium insidiosum]